MLFRASEITLCVCFFLHGALILPSHAHDVDPGKVKMSAGLGSIQTSTALLENSFQNDGKTVYFMGEVIGSIMERNEGTWINVLDKTNAIGVFFEGKSLDGIDFTGSYKEEGDMILVKGTFNRACNIHRGELDIHAESFMIVQRGHKLAHPLNSSLFFWAIFFLILTTAVYVAHRSMRTKRVGSTDRGHTL